MTNTREEVEKLVQQLERQRDELQVKIALARLEARDEWDKLEKQWDHLKATVPKLREELSSTAGGVEAAVKKAAGEIRDGYERLRKLL